jgi:hypothetical protein
LKVVAFRDRALQRDRAFRIGAGSRNESPLLRDALPEVTRIARMVGMDLQGTIVSLDGVYVSTQPQSHFQSRYDTQRQPEFAG